MVYRFSYVLKRVTWWFSMGMLNNQMVTTSDCHQIVFADWLGFCFEIPNVIFIELDDGKIYRKALYLMVKTMVSCNP